jgi:ABC-type transport system involved in multi-copper enzyme maturation permease subunit
MYRKFIDQAISLLYYFGGLLAYSWMMIAMFPTMKTADLAGIYNQFPKEFLKFFGANGIESMGTVEGFLSIEFLSLFFILIIAFYIGSSAGSTIAGAIEKRTMDFQLSQPISRAKLLLSETIVGLLNTALLVFATSGSIYILAKAYDVSMSTRGIFVFAFVAIIFLWAFYGLAVLISSILRSKITVASITVSIIMGLYILNALSKIVDKLAKIEKYTLFNMYNPQKLLTDHIINWHQIEFLLLVLVVGIISSILIFNNKDI